MAKCPTTIAHPSLIRVGAHANGDDATLRHGFNGREKIRVICVDDHELIAEGLSAIFELDGRFHLIRALRSADQLLAEVRRLQPNIVLMDIEIPGTDAFAAVTRLHAIAPEVRVIFFSAYVKQAYITSALNCHADGYFSKADDFERLMDSIASSVQSPGQGFLMGDRVRQQCGEDLLPRAPKFRMLTPRELEVLRLIGEGHRRADIASTLVCSVRTVDGHQDHIMRKLGLDTRESLIRFAIREGIAQA